MWFGESIEHAELPRSQFDPDIRGLVSVVLVHGSWRREDSNRIRIDVGLDLNFIFRDRHQSEQQLLMKLPQDACKRWSNVRAVTAHMSEMFGCHHSKCMVLLRHDNLAQIVVHTANMIEQDWRNLTQGVWLSPLLPSYDGQRHASRGMPPSLGTGARFKLDFLSYLRYYGSRTKELVLHLEQFDFSAIKAALIAHVPSKFDPRKTKVRSQLWGWPALQQALLALPWPTRSSGRSCPGQENGPQVVCQVSSIATVSDKWLHDTFFPALATSSGSSSTARQQQSVQSLDKSEDVSFSIIFPTPAEVRTSLDGYAAGASIHCKLQTASQRKQFESLKPSLHRWNPEADVAESPSTSFGPQRLTLPTSAFQNATSGRLSTRDALRGPACPHIKTFIRFRNNTRTSIAESTLSTTSPQGAKPDAHSEIDWALLTSANLSTQAWGTACNASTGEVRISSYELGVLVWPELFDDELGHYTAAEEKMDDAGSTKHNPTTMLSPQNDHSRRSRVRMVPTLGIDTPQARSPNTSSESIDWIKHNSSSKNSLDQPQPRPKHPQHNSKSPKSASCSTLLNPKTNAPTVFPSPPNQPPDQADHAILVGLRLPYSLPLTPYKPNDIVWSGSTAHHEPDRFGQVWHV